MLIASQPTRGLDVGSIEFVHRRIVEQRDHGVAVLIVSSELDEIYALSDRIAVMYEGKITGFRDPDVPAAELGRLMAGGADTAPAERHGASRGTRASRGDDGPRRGRRRRQPHHGHRHARDRAPRRSGGLVTTAPPSPPEPPRRSGSPGESAAYVRDSL